MWKGKYKYMKRSFSFLEQKKLFSEIFISRGKSYLVKYLTKSEEFSAKGEVIQ